MRDKDWKKAIINWNLSRKRQLFKEKLKYRKMYLMNDDELLSAIEAAFEYACLDDEDKEAFDFLDHDFQGKNLSDILTSHIQTLLQWYYYQIKYERTQQFEVCASIRDVIALEQEEVERIIRTYFPNQLDIDLLEKLRDNSRVQADTNYEQWDELIKKESK